MKTRASDALIALRLAVLILDKHPQWNDDREITASDLESVTDENMAMRLYEDILWGKVGFGDTKMEKVVSPMRAFLAFCDSDQEENGLIFQFSLTSEECDAYTKRMQSTGISVDLDSMEAVGVEVGSCLSNAATKIFSDLCRDKSMKVNGEVAFELATFLASVRDELFAQSGNKEIAMLRFRPVTIPIKENEAALRQIAKRVFSDTEKGMEEGVYPNALKWKVQERKMIEVISDRNKNYNDCWLRADSLPREDGLLPIETIIALESKDDFSIADIKSSGDFDYEVLVRDLSDEADKKSGWIQVCDFEFSHSPLAIRKNGQVITYKVDGKVKDENTKNRRKALQTLAFFVGENGVVKSFQNRQGLADKMHNKLGTVSSKLSHARELLKEIQSEWTISNGKPNEQIRLEQ